MHGPCLQLGIISSQVRHVTFALTCTATQHAWWSLLVQQPILHLGCSSTLNLSHILLVVCHHSLLAPPGPCFKTFLELYSLTPSGSCFATCSRLGLPGPSSPTTPPSRPSSSSGCPLCPAPTNPAATPYSTAQAATHKHPAAMPCSHQWAATATSGSRQRAPRFSTS